MWHEPIGPDESPRGAAAGGRLAALLAPSRVCLGIPLPDARALFEFVAAQLPLRDHRAGALVVQRLARRHARRSTALGGGLALPHAEVTHLGAPLAVFVRPALPLPFGAADGHPVRDVLVLLVPKPASSHDHALLIELTHHLQSPALRQALAGARSVDEVHRALVSASG